LAVGCGDKYALYLKPDMTGGYTAPCSTFNNEVLSKKGTYELLNLEIWGMDYC